MESPETKNTENSDLENDESEGNTERDVDARNTKSKEEAKSKETKDKEAKERELQKIYRNLEKQSVRVRAAIDDDVGSETIQSEYKVWLSLYEHYIMKHNEFCMVLTEAQHVTYYSQIFALQDLSLRKFKSYVDEVLVKQKSKVPNIVELSDDTLINQTNEHLPILQPTPIEENLSTQGNDEMPLLSVQNGYSRHSSIASQSSKLSRSSKASITSAKIKHMEQMENLKAEQLYLKKRQELEKAKLELSQRQRVLEVEMKLEQSLAKCKALDTMELLEENGPGIYNHTQQTTQNLNPAAKEYVPKPYPRQETSRTNCEVPTAVESNKMMLSFAKILSKPQTDIHKFSGSPRNYQRFIRQFNSQVVAVCESEEEKLNYLSQYTTGEANKIVSGLCYSHSTTAFTDALHELYLRYGTPEIIANAMVKDAINWPIIKADNPKKLDEFAIFLTECNYAIKDLNAVKVLEYPDNIRKLVQKLPFFLHDRWRNIVSRLRENERSIKFDELVKFVRTEAKKANDPLYGKEALSFPSTFQNKASQHFNRSDSSKPKQSMTVNNIQKVEETHHKTYGKPKNSYEHKSKDMGCSYCEEKTHILADCFKLQAKPIDERLNFIRSQGVCFGCLTAGHRRKTCRKLITCSKCHRYHPLVLHQDEFEKKKSEEKSSEDKPTSGLVNASSTTIKSGSDMGAGECKMAIIPVKARMKGKLTTVVTYAFFDNGSSIVMGTNTLADLIGGTGIKKRLTLDTVAEPYEFLSTAINGIEIAAIDGDEFLPLPTVYTKDEMPVNKSHIPTKTDLEEWSHLKDIEILDIDAEIGLLIGTNVPEAYRPLEFIIGPKGTPHATRTLLGWIPWNIVREKESIESNMVVNKVHISALQEAENLEKLVKDSYMYDFPEKVIEEQKENSVEDTLFLDKVNKSITLKDGHYHINLPFKDDIVKFPDNKQQALLRLGYLKRKLTKNIKYSEDYNRFIEDLFVEGYAEKVPENEEERLDDKRWYIPHHGVYHPRKPDQIRVVFDCRAQYEGVSLNNLLLPGPNLTNNLLGVLIRFRQERIAIQGDLKKMFYSVMVPPDDRDCLRFLWWPNGNTNLNPETYRMKVHIFGATSSPSCSNAALRLTATANAEYFNEETISTVLDNFYVDDCLKSEANEEKAIQRIRELKKLCELGGFTISKFASNSRTVLQSLPVEERSKEMKVIDVEKDDLPVGRVLGVTWFPETDNFGFQITVRERKPTRRGILSMTSSVYDPLGFASPFILTAKLILQELTRQNLDWDTEISKPDQEKWNKWLKNLPLLEKLCIPRCFKPAEFGTIINTQLHSFADASNIGYGVIIYLRLEDQRNKMHVAMVMAKSRVVPLKRTTIPRLELTAATMAVRITRMIVKELDLKIDQHFYWTDSQTVLKYIANKTARFYTFVANRLGIIKESTEMDQWHYCPTKLNPADMASRGICPSETSKIGIWQKGPEFLWNEEVSWPKNVAMSTQIEKDPEVKPVNAMVVNQLQPENETIEDLIERISSWRKTRNIMKKVLEFIYIMKQKIQNRRDSKNQKIEIPKQELEFKAEKVIISYFQMKHFSQEITQLNNNEPVKKSSSLYKLDPFIEDSLIRIGGRIDRAELNYDEKHPVVIPKGCKLSESIILESHKLQGHLGRKSTICHIRQRYWIIGVNRLVKQLLIRCVICRKYSAKALSQQMADLPSSRVKFAEPPFSRVGVDYFGPIEIKRGRSVVKRWGVVFTCLSLRAVHLEIAHTLDMSSCINAIRRFQARRGSTLEFISDNGSNFVGSKTEIEEEIKKWNAEYMEKSLEQQQTKWRFNPPTGSHFGGVWERMIRIIRKILYSLLKEQVLKIDDEGLQTIFCEVENIINNRPLTEISDDPKDLNLEVLTPNHLLLLRKGPELSPGIFNPKDNYAKKRWRQIQHITDIFWKRWIKEYLPLLQYRQKWLKPEKNLSIDDIVLLVDSTPRNSWSLGRVKEVFTDNKGLSRVVTVKTKNNILKRPIDKLCLILEANSE